MQRFLALNYWFSLRPESLRPETQKIFIGLVIFLAASALIIAIIKSRGGIYRGVFNRLYSFGLGNAIIGLILLFFNYEIVPFFSARFWLGLWAIIMIVWFIFILKKLTSIPAQKKELNQEKELKKYLP